MIARAVPWIVLGCAAMAGCADGPAPLPESGSAAAPSTGLPLQRGFYVVTDTACESASNATLGLLHGQGLNSSREDCVFVSIVAHDSDRFRIVEQCTILGAGEVSRIVTEWQVQSPRAFRRTLDSGWTAEMRYCEQQTLPDAWRQIDLDAAITRDTGQP